ncbi:MAG TPA: magnesium transporter CorA family protein [Candidatus Saccharimonadales bacterium]|nr:magnesium transporter CorA family protein [Candidatus Saccharimonadales bacterium]
MIKNYYKSLRTDSVQELQQAKRGSWVYAEAPTGEELAELSEQYGLDLGNLQDAMDVDEMPRLDKEDGHSYIFVRFAYKDSNDELDTAPLLIVFAGEIVFTIVPVRLPVIEKFLNGKIDFASTQRTKLILQLLQEIVEQYDNYISRTSKRIKYIRSRLRDHGISNKDFADFVMIEDELNEFLGALQPNNSTLRRLLIGRHIPLFEEDQDIVEDLMLNNEQSIETCNSNIKSIINIREAYTSISTNNLNQTIKILTIATVVIALPNLFYGMYGMNVPLPLQHEPWAYWVVLSVTVCVPLIGLWYAHKRKII